MAEIWVKHRHVALSKPSELVACDTDQAATHAREVDGEDLLLATE